MFHTFLFCLFMWRPMGVFSDEVKSVSVMEGDSVTLHADITDIQRDDQIVWSFGLQETRIAQMMDNKIFINDDVLDGRFKDRLQVNDQTGDLTITHITTQHSGLYQIIISSAREISYRFNVTVYGVLSVSVMEGDSVTLHTDTEILPGDVIVWMFGPQKTTIALINRAANKISIYDDVLDGRFRDRLQIGQTGDLTITNITTHFSGVYQVTISSKQKTSHKFSVTVCGVFGDEVKSVSVMKGDSVTLHPDITEIQTADLILWMFGPQKTRLAKINKEAKQISIYDDERFRDRLQLNDQTGDLTITNITTQHSGLYEVNIYGRSAISSRFSIAVCDSVKL